jgi:hypothetical protein
MIKEVCNKCNLEIERNVDHDCIKSLKHAFAEERKRVEDTQRLLLMYMTKHKDKI